MQEILQNMLPRFGDRRQMSLTDIFNYSILHNVRLIWCSITHLCSLWIKVHLEMSVLRDVGSCRIIIHIHSRGKLILPLIRSLKNFRDSLPRKPRSKSTLMRLIFALGISCNCNLQRHSSRNPCNRGGLKSHAAWRPEIRYRCNNPCVQNAHLLGRRDSGASDHCD